MNAADDGTIYIVRAQIWTDGWVTLDQKLTASRAAAQVWISVLANSYPRAERVYAEICNAAAPHGAEL